MTDTELLSLIDVIQTSKAEFQTVEVKRAEKSNGTVQSDGASRTCGIHKYRD